MDPYALGLLLGDGCLTGTTTPTFATGDAELAHADPLRRQQALVKLGSDPGPDELACLIQALGDDVATVSHQARGLLKSITGRDLAFDRDEWLAWWKQNAHRACQTCGKRLYDQRLYYKVKTDITCEPRELVITDQDLADDHGARMQEICDQL